MSIRDWIISLAKKTQKCGCKNNKHTQACEKFSTDAKKTVKQANALSTQNKNV